MFTGLIETTGTITGVNQHGLSVTLGIEPDLESYEVAIGGSVAIDGACLTVERCERGILYFTAVRETLSRTTLADIRVGRIINLERALRLSDRLDGHLVLGHVDGVGTIGSDRKIGVSLVRTIRYPESLRPFITEKGSVAIDGISLTVVSVSDTDFSVSLIPHTLAKTTLIHKKTGDPVNLECDVVARYLYRFLGVGKTEPQENTPSSPSESLLGRMERLGF